jgi:hypothetical protein
MIRTRKEVDWSKHLTAEDLGYLSVRIEPTQWYPMDAFERMGLAILAELVGGGTLEPVRAFGRASIDGLKAQHPDLIAAGNPRESLMRFQVLRRSFFDYSALELVELLDTRAVAQVSYGMGPVAEEAATWQTMGFFDRLLQLSGAQDVSVTCIAKAWEGAPRTLVEMRWQS